MSNRSAENFFYKKVVLPNNGQNFWARDCPLFGGFTVIKKKYFSIFLLFSRDFCVAPDNWGGGGLKPPVDPSFPLCGAVKTNQH